MYIILYIYILLGEKVQAPRVDGMKLSKLKWR